ncbi:MAG TPA: DUF6252 family protein [Chryseosolibacter sp.]
MKRIAVFLLLALTACSSDPESKKAPAGMVMMTIDGTEMLSVSASAVVTSASLTGNPSVGVDAAYNTPNGKYIIMLRASTHDVFKLMDVGEYTVEGKDLPANTGIIYYTPEGAPSSNAYSSLFVGTDVVGKIVITSIDTTNKFVSGTFECTVAHSDTGEMLSITGGSFTQIPYRD